MIETAVVVTALLCGVVAGLLFSFAVVAMPGIKTLDDREFIRAFQVMDRIIQDNQPLFMLAWVGSVIAVVASVVIGLFQLEDGTSLALLIVSAVVYLIGVQLPTATINIPLNNRLQLVEVHEASEQELAAERSLFEDRWNRWNRIRTGFAVTATGLLLILLLRL